MSNLNTAIGEQAFELITKRIGEILADELANQLVLQPTIPVLGAKVWYERQTQFNTDELPAMSVKFVGSNYDNHDVKESDGANNYHIDCYVPGKATDTDKGDQVAMINLKRLLGVIRSILSSPFYYSLGFQNPNPFIKSRRVLNIDISEPEDNQDGKNVMMGRVTIRVDAVETSEEILPKDLNNYCTTVKLHETDKGFIWKTEK